MGVLLPDKQDNFQSGFILVKNSKDVAGSLFFDGFGAGRIE
jgi:hypothetical protein